MFLDSSKETSLKKLFEGNLFERNLFERNFFEIATKKLCGAILRMSSIKNYGFSVKQVIQLFVNLLKPDIISHSTPDYEANIFCSLAYLLNNCFSNLKTTTLLHFEN